MAFLDRLSDRAFWSLCCAVIAVVLVAAVPLTDFVIRHLEFLRIFSEQERRIR